MTIPAGNPSITPPIPLPWDSPKLVSLKILPNELNILNKALKFSICKYNNKIQERVVLLSFPLSVEDESYCNWHQT